MPFRTEFSKNIFEYKYKHEKAETWEQLSKTLIEDVCGGLLPQEEIDELVKYHSEMKFIAGGRYLYYAGRLNKFFNNCFLLKACVDNREDWADLSWKSESCLMVGGGIGIDYSVYRPKGSIIKRTGGHASGTVSKMEMINEIGRRVMQGGSRRCLPEDSLVYTERGLIKIKDVIVGENVYTENGINKIINKIEQGYQNIDKIITNSGVFYGTSNHKMAVLNENGDKIWKQIDELKQGDVLCHFNKEVKGKKLQLPNDFTEIRPKNSSTCQPISIPNLDVDLAWLIGLVHGDGYVYNRKNIRYEQNIGGSSYVSISFNSNDEKCYIRAKEVFERFGTNVTIEFRKNENCVNVRASGQRLAEYFENYIKQPKEIIQIPNFILENTSDIRGAYLAGIVDSDGCIKNRPINLVTTVYQSFAEQLQNLCSSIGIATRLSSHTPKQLNWQKKHIVSFIGFRQEYNEKIGEYSSKGLVNYTRMTYGFTVPMSIVKKQFKPKDLKKVVPSFKGKGLNYQTFKDYGGEIDFIPVEVKSIEYNVKNVQTFDIEVENDHNFYCNGLLTHNSAIYASLNWKHGDVEEFLHAKDWYNMPVSGAFDENGNQLTIGKLKELDFNYHAPLDMTNVSLNYDNDFLEEVYGKSFDELKEIYKKEGSMGIFNLPIVSLPIVFIENCRQALKTGEPGFSFNFFEKVIETLRNAPIVGETWVLTKEGYKQVLDIVGREVEVWTGLQWAKTIFTKTRKDSPTVTVTMTGRKEITCSPDHEFITSDGRRIAAKDLDIGEQLKVSLGVYTHGKIVQDAYLLGFAYGDGSFHKKYSRLEIPLCSDKIKCKDRILDSIIQPLSCNEDIRGIYRMYYGNNDLFSNRNKKEFPSDVFSWDFNSRKSFLEGLLDADGNTSLGHARLSSVNFEFLKGVGRLCETLGLTCGINKGSNGGFKNTPSWNLIIKGDTDFLKTERVNIEKSNPIIFKVVSIEESNISDVFCCNVGVDEHSFQAEGIIISNCTEVTSADDSDVCNLGSINMSRIKTIDEFIRVNYLASKFLVCGTLKATLPYQKIYEVREKNRRLGLGLMGVHEWLLQRGYKYEVVPELHDWLKSYKEQSELGANQLCKQLNISKPVAYRAIAPTGTIGIMAG